MTIRHAEPIRRIGEVRISLPGEYHVLEVEVTTANNIKKTLRLSESEASHLVASLTDALSTRTEEGKADRFHASIRAGMESGS